MQSSCHLPWAVTSNTFGIHSVIPTTSWNCLTVVFIVILKCFLKNICPQKPLATALSHVHEYSNIYSLSFSIAILNFSCLLMSRNVQSLLILRTTTIILISSCNCFSASNLVLNHSFGLSCSYDSGTEVPS